MLGGDSGRFLCFCLRRSLSFRLWGRRGDQILVLGAFGDEYEYDMFMWGVDSSEMGFVAVISPYGETGGLWLDRSGSGRFL